MVEARSNQGNVPVGIGNPNSINLGVATPDWSTVNMGLPEPNFATDAGSSTSDSGGIGSILSGIGGVLNGPLGTMATLGGEYALIANQAKNTQAENKGLADQISAIGAPDVTAGKSLLDQYTAGKLSAPFQATVDAEKQQSAMTATSQTQQVAQLLANSGAGQNVQSAMVGESGQIAAAKNLADTQAMSNAFMQELQASLNLTNTGGAYVQAGIMQEIQSNTQLQQQLAQLMGALANAYAKSTGSGTGSGTGGNPLGNLFNQAGKLLTGSGGPDVSKLISGANAGAAALGAGGLAALNNDPTGVNAQLAAGANGPLTMATAADPSAVEIGPLTQDPALGLGPDPQEINASTGGGGIDTAALGGAAGAAGAAGVAAAGAGAAPAGVVTIGELGGDIFGTGAAAGAAEGGAAAAGAAGAGGGAGATGAAIGGGASADAAGGGAAASIGAAALPIAAALGVGLLAYEGFQNSPDVIKTVGPGQSVVKLQSGQQALREGNFAIGSGGDTSKGSGQSFLIPAKTMTIGGKTATAGQPFALPKSFVSAGEVPIAMKGGKPDFSSITYDPKMTDPKQALAIKAQIANSVGGFGQSKNPAQTAALQAQYNSAALSASYNSTGGQAAWGVPFSTWLQQTYNVQQNIKGQTW